MNKKINIKAVIIKLISKWHYFIITAVIIFPIAYVYIKYAPKVYAIRASLLLKSDQQNGLSGNEFLKGMELFASQTELEDEIGILKSYSMVENAIRDLDFGVSYYAKSRFKTVEKYGDAPFTVKLDSNYNQIVEVPIWIYPLPAKRYRIVADGKELDAYNFYTGLVEDHFKMVHIDTVVEAARPLRLVNLGLSIYPDSLYKPRVDEKYYVVIHNLSSVVESYQNALAVDPISRESNIVELSMRGTVPHKTVAFLNRLLEVYLENELLKKNQLGIRTIQFIDDHLSSVSDSLRRAEGWLESFRVKSNIQNISSTAENLSKNLDRLETEKADIEVKLKYYTYISNSLEEGRLGDVVAPSTFDLEDPLLSNLLIELSRLSQERAGLNYNTKEQNPLAEVVELKIRNTKKTLQENVNNIINVSSIALNDLDRRILRIRNDLTKLPRNERELVNIQRKFDFNDHVYNYLLEKRAEAGIAIASNAVEKSVVDPAKIIGGGPVSPNSKIIYAIVLFLIITIPIAFIILKDFWNDHIVSVEDVEQATEIPFIGTIVHGSKHERESAGSKKGQLLSESFQSLRVNLQYITLGKEKKVIGFTSSVASEGKTFCAINTAMALAQSGKKTILVDVDMRRPSVSTYFKMDNSKGLSNYLVGACSLSEIIHPTHNKDFNIITSGPIPPNPLNLVGLPQMEQLISTLRHSYDAVILDAPPIGFVAEYIILMKYTDANIYVVRSEYTSRSNLSMINKLYGDKKISNVNILLNDVKTGLNGYAYAYRTANST